MDKEYEKIKFTQISGRYLPSDKIAELASKNWPSDQWHPSGFSVLGKPVHRIRLGRGAKRILMWSQMHGNESTTTKGLLDFMAWLHSGTEISEKFLNHFSFSFLPILNPDGADRYTRFNANEMDLNRDALNQSQPESVVLRKEYEDFQPDFCFNLHDQRTIYNVGNSRIPATLSFLAPAMDAGRSVPANRLTAMQLIAYMNERLLTILPGGVGRYDDTFNPNCVGDHFQSLGTPTLLFEAGHYPGDYERESSRYYFFKSLIYVLEGIMTGEYASFSQEDYLGIPENAKQFVDILIRRPDLISNNHPRDAIIGICFKEVLADGEIQFVPELSEKEGKEEVYGHQEWDLSQPEQMALLKKRPGIIKLIS
ncbi:M14 family metallopeptidase [Robiginitalea sp. IMCC44478]|uniref:M14 family metallopeptidase n=1 Tax=Robiginitalea sp. IMCC44478 TaxID=3459122 RepID=UPI00404339F7